MCTLWVAVGAGRVRRSGMLEDSSGGEGGNELAGMDLEPRLFILCPPVAWWVCSPLLAMHRGRESQSSETALGIY